MQRNTPRDLSLQSHKTSQNRTKRADYIKHKMKINIEFILAFIFLAVMLFGISVYYQKTNQNVLLYEQELNRKVLREQLKERM